MALCVASKVIGVNVLYAAFIDVAGRDVAGGNEVAEPLGRVRVDLVVVGRHTVNPPAPDTESPFPASRASSGCCATSRQSSTIGAVHTLGEGNG
jgi:hypothetical protein